jgi:hypothetical protein
MYSIFWTNLIPQGGMLVFAVMTYYNIKKTQQRLARLQNRTNSHLITITFFQVLCSSVLLNTRTAYFAYTRFSTGLTKDAHRQAIEALLLEISSFIFYFNFAKSFFVNTLSSKLFRQVFQERSITIYYRLTCCRNRVHPI